jgi:hypothetical protein
VSDVPSERHFRAFARRAIQLPATVSTPADGPKPARLVNLGLGGACVSVSAGLDVGSVVTLEVNAPNLWDPLVVPATVAWIRWEGRSAAHAGLAFNHALLSGLPALVELLVAYRYD